MARVGRIAGSERGGARLRRGLVLAAGIAIAAGGAGRLIAQGAIAADRLTPRERTDALEPWSFEPWGAPAPVPLPLPPPALPDTTARVPNAPAIVPPQAGAEAPTDTLGSERVQVVRCRQVLVSDPVQAARLDKLLRSGVSFEEAQHALGRIEFEERNREYVLDDLDPQIRAAVEALPEGGWSDVRPWRGRSALFQVVSKAERERRTVPRLGQGLDQEERNRLAAIRRQTPRRLPPNSADETADVDKAAVVQQVSPEYPPSASISGEVTVRVDIGLNDNVVTVELLQSSDPIFVPPAVAAAQHSTYRSARRNGVPENDSVTLTFKFVAPQADTTGTRNPNGDSN